MIQIYVNFLEKITNYFYGLQVMGRRGAGGGSCQRHAWRLVTDDECGGASPWRAPCVGDSTTPSPPAASEEDLDRSQEPKTFAPLTFGR